MLCTSVFRLSYPWSIFGQTGNIKDYLTFALVGGLFVIALFCLYLTRTNLAAKIRDLIGS